MLFYNQSSTISHLSKTCLKAYDRGSLANIRFTEMAPFPMVLVCHTKNGRKWFVRNKAVSTWYTPKAELDAESNAFDVMFGNKEKASRALIGADAWFGNSRAEQYEMYEQTQRMGDEAFALLEITNEAMLEA